MLCMKNARLTSLKKNNSKLWEANLSILCQEEVTVLLILSLALLKVNPKHASYT